MLGGNSRAILLSRHCTPSKKEEQSEPKMKSRFYVSKPRWKNKPVTESLSEVKVGFIAKSFNETARRQRMQ